MMKGIGKIKKKIRGKRGNSNFRLVGGSLSA
jgi:hypothetical protein